MSSLLARPRPQADTTRVSDQLVDVLFHHGVRLALGIPGGTIASVYDALLARPDIRYVQTRHEAAAVFAAGAYGRQTGRPAVVLVTSGPGVLNTVCALASAQSDGLPMVLLVGEVARDRQGRHALQDGSAHQLDIVGSLRSLCKHVAAVPNAGAAAPMLHDALQRCVEGRPGPVVLTLPTDVTHQSVSVMKRTAPPAPPRQLGSLDVGEVSAAMARGKKVVLLAGSGCRSHGGPDAVRRLAEHGGFPVVTTPKGKGVFPESHALSRGIFGIGGHPSSSHVLEDADVVVAMGTSLGELATSAWSSLLQAEGALIQVDVDGAVLGRTYAIQHGVNASVTSFVRAVLPSIPRRPWVQQPSGIERMDAPAGDAIHPGLAVRSVQAMLPDDTVFLLDSGEHTLFGLHHLQIDRPDSFMAMLGLGAMGSGIAGSIGVALAQPGRPVACLCGDGGMLMHLGELATAAAESLPIRYFVFNDGCLGMVRHGHDGLYGRSFDFDTGQTDFASAAKSMGIRSFQVDRLDELGSLHEILREHAGPVLVDLRIDGSVVFPKGARLAALATA